MFEQTIIDTVIVIGMFVLRVGVPVAILFFAAKWLEKKLKPEETQINKERRPSARIIPFARPLNQNQATPTEDAPAKHANAK